ncbi:MAG: hypothetical protein ACRCVV_22020 [Shewanella sp.]
MTIQISGVLKPFGTPIANAVIKVTSLTNDGVLKGVYLTRCTDANGAYSFQLENGIYLLEYKQQKVMVPVGKVFINDSTSSPLTLEELMNTAPLVDIPAPPTSGTDWDKDVNEHLANAEVNFDMNQAVSGDASSLDYEEASSTPNSFLGRAIDKVESSQGASTKQVLEFSKGSNGMAKEVDTLEVKEASIAHSKALYADADYAVEVESTITLPELELVDGFSRVKDTSSYTITDSERLLAGNGYKANTYEAVTGLNHETNSLVSSEGVGVLQDSIGVTSGKEVSIDMEYRDDNGVQVKAPRMRYKRVSVIDGGLSHSTIEEGSEQLVTKDEETLTKWYHKVITYAREGLDEITNNGFSSVRKFIYDKLQFGDVLFVDNKSKEVKVVGKLVIENRDDFVGDTIFQVFQYSIDGVTGWHDKFAIEDKWRRHNTSVNGYINPNNWSEPYLLQAEDGHEGDTLYFQYRYSTDKVNWHSTFVDGDIWRQERIIENGYPITEWSTPARIIGADGIPGDTVTIEYQYSIDGFEPWHSNFSTGDHYRRERLVTNGVAGPWSPPAKIVPEKDVDYTDGKDGINGAKTALVYLYKRAISAGLMPSTTCTYNFTTKTLTGYNNDWQPTPPSGSGTIWLTVATASSIGESDTIAPNEWAEAIKFSDGGIGVTGVINYYAVSASSTIAPTSWSTTVPATSYTNKYLWNYEKVTYSDGTSTNTQAAVIGTHDGVGIQSVAEYYLASAASSGVTTGTAGWTTTIQTTSSAKKYLWNYEVTTYTDGSTRTTAPVIIGTHGEAGVGITGVVNYYAKSSSSTVPPTSWATSVPALDIINKYLWNYERVNKSDSTYIDSIPAVIGTMSTDGVGIESVTEYYLASASASGVTTATAGWTTSMQTTDTTKRYLWNYEVTTYTDKTSTITLPVIIGTHGATGDNGYNAATLTIYQRASSAPALPTANVVYTFATGSITGLNNNWSYTIPTSGSGTIWISTATALSRDATDTISPSEWAAPAVLAQSGEAGKHGAGSYVVVVANISYVPNDAGKDNHILQLAARPAQSGDMLTYTTPANAADTDKFVRQYIRNANAWEAFIFAVDGSAVINGTLAAQALKAESAIVDKLYISDANAQNEMTLSGKGNYRIWSGNADPTLAPFSVDKQGNLTAKNGVFSGKVEMIGADFMMVQNPASWGSEGLWYWFGKKSLLSNGSPNLAFMTKANALEWKDIYGNGYYGGLILSGELVNKLGNYASTYSSVPYTAITTPSWSSFGRTRQLLVEWDLYWSQTFMGQTGTDYTTQGWIDIKLESRFNGGNWINRGVDTYPIVLSVSYEEENPVDKWAYYYLKGAGSRRINEPAGTSGSYEYRVSVTRYYPCGIATSLQNQFSQSIVLTVKE